MRNQNKVKFIKLTIFIFMISVMSLTSVGCTPLKKKFVRQKKDKNQVENFIPVLEPIAYEEIEQSAQKEYASVYGLWKIWQKDLLEDIEKGRSEKNQKYLLGEIITSLGKMQKFLVQEKYSGIEAVINQYEKIEKQYARPDNFRQKSTLKRGIDAAGKVIRSQYTPRLLKEEDYQN